LQAVRSGPDFARRLARVRERAMHRRPTLLAFFLFDERRSHHIVLEFARGQSSWLNQLAGANQMILFLFLPEAEPAAYAESEDSILVADGDQTVANPSLDVARRFGIGPSELPGIVFFTELDGTQPGPHEGVYCPLSLEVFRGDADQAERAFSYLFGLVQQARAEVADPTLLLETLRRKVEMEHDKEPERPIVEDLRGGRVITFEGALKDVTTVAFATGLGL
jgi:hypothetical protein